MQIIICADATPEIGTGHVMRCIALAQAFIDAGHKVQILTQTAVPWVRERLHKENLSITYKEGSLQELSKPERLMHNIHCVLESFPPQKNWIILDGYHFGAECHKAVLASGFQLLIIDDYNHLSEYNCHILLNQNIDAHQYNYSGSIGKKLLGLSFTLLRREFLQARIKKQVTRSNSNTILISLGGGNFIDDLANVATSFTSDVWQKFTIRIILGSMDETLVKGLFANCPASIELLHNIDNMAALLQDTRACITAGGSTCWELLCMGVPFLVTAITPNQQGITNFLIKEELAGSLDVLTSNNFFAFFDENTNINVQTVKFKNTIDGLGAIRVLDAIIKYK